MTFCFVFGPQCMSVEQPGSSTNAVMIDQQTGDANSRSDEVRLTQSLSQTNFPVLAYLTNLGVSIMDRGDTDMARFLFRSALNLRSNRMEEAKVLPLVRAAEVWLSQILEEEGDVFASADAASSNKDDPRTTVLPFIHAKGMNILSVPGVYSFDVTTHWKLVTCLILFNLALSHHLSAVLQTTEKEAQGLTTARALYEQCRNLLQGASDVSPLIDFLSLALTNNLAHTCYMLDQFAESEQYYAQIISLSPRTIELPRHAAEAEDRVIALVSRHKT